MRGEAVSPQDNEKRCTGQIIFIMNSNIVSNQYSDMPEILAGYIQSSPCPFELCHICTCISCLYTKSANYADLLHYRQSRQCRFRRSRAMEAWQSELAARSTSVNRWLPIGLFIQGTPFIIRQYFIALFTKVSVPIDFITFNTYISSIHVILCRVKHLFLTV